MRSLAEVVKTPSALDSWANYAGPTEFPGWYCLRTQTRDSGCLEESNFRSALRLLGGEDEGNGVVIHRFGHWACGWWEALAVREGSPAFAIAESIAERLDGYPVVDESDWSELESETADRVWRDCYGVPERIAYIREHRSQFEFRDFADVIGCVRGRYFAGYASELVD